MGIAAFLNHGFNLPFLVMLGLAAVFVMLQAIGFVGHGDSDVEVDHDVDVEADVDADADADVDHDVDADADGHAAFGAQSALAFFGVGRVPFMVVWLTLFIFTGISGIFLNGFVFSHFGGDYPGWAFPLVCAISLAIGLVAVRLFSRVAARLVDVAGRGAVAKHELTGRVGVVASNELGPSSKGVGEIRVRDDRGNELLLHARVDGGEATLRRGDEVLLVDYDADDELFLVTSDTDGLGPAKNRTTRTTKN